MDKQEILNLEERFRKAVHGNTMIMKYLGFTLGKINLTKEEIQEVMNYLTDKEEYELCDKLQKYEKTKRHIVNGLATDPNTKR